jgi:hypothetical protein
MHRVSHVIRFLFDMQDRERGKSQVHKTVGEKRQNDKELSFLNPQINIHILTGGIVPFILRKKEEHYRLVGA